MSSKIDIKCVYLNENFEILDANREFYVYFDAVGHDLNTLEDFTGTGSLSSLKKFLLSENKQNKYKLLKFKKNCRTLKTNFVTAYNSIFKGQKSVCLKMIDIEQCI